MHFWCDAGLTSEAPADSFMTFNNAPGRREPRVDVPVPDLPMNAFKWVLEKGVVQDDSYKSLDDLLEQNRCPHPQTPSHIEGFIHET